MTLHAAVKQNIFLILCMILIIFTTIYIDILFTKASWFETILSFYPFLLLFSNKLFFDKLTFKFLRNCSRFRM